MIEIAVEHAQGDFAIAAEIRAGGRVLALCGPSGAGKTTLLDLIAGLKRPRRGRIAVDEAVFLDTARGLDVPARLRRIGYVFQEPRLFPHLNVAHNLRYGARFASRGPRLVAFADVVALLGLEPLLARGPARLSGGEKQRVAIGRALLSNPRVLLMDEPLNAIDDPRRREILQWIETLRDAVAIPIVFVSHRVSEVERLASDIAVIEAGRLVEMRATKEAR
ncbi:MAG: ATP-binding cassette domain-containing protein [Roseiarcus sp.]